MKRYDIYLAGAMHSRSVGEVLAERLSARRLCDMYDLSVYDPASDEGLDQLSHGALIDAAPDLDKMHSYVLKDEKHLGKCRALLVLTGDRSSSGTAWEMALAHYELNIPIFLVAPRMARKELVNFTTIKADFICGTQAEAIELLADYLSVQEE